MLVDAGHAILAAMRLIGALLLLTTLLVGCASERHIYRDSDGERASMEVPLRGCLGVGATPVKSAPAATAATSGPPPTSSVAVGWGPENTKRGVCCNPAF